MNKLIYSFGLSQIIETFENISKLIFNVYKEIKFNEVKSNSSKF